MATLSSTLAAGTESDGSECVTICAVMTDGAYAAPASAGRSNMGRARSCNAACVQVRASSSRERQLLSTASGAPFQRREWPSGSPVPRTIRAANKGRSGLNRLRWWEKLYRFGGTMPSTWGRRNMSKWQDEKENRNRRSIARLTGHCRASFYRPFRLGRSSVRSCRRHPGLQLIPTGGRIQFALIVWPARSLPAAGHHTAGPGGLARTRKRIANNIPDTAGALSRTRTH